MVAVASFIHTTVVDGLVCEDLCAACWKDGDPNGVDIKMRCEARNKGCAKNCPSGYSRMHCAQYKRCA